MKEDTLVLTSGYEWDGGTPVALPHFARRRKKDAMDIDESDCMQRERKAR